MGDYMNATFLQRFLAYIIDILIIVILLNLITYNINFDKRNDLNSEITNYLTEYDPTDVESVNKLLDLQYQYNKESILVDAVSVIMTVGYFIVFQYFNKGQTIGKKLLKIRISGKDNKKVGIGQLVLRSIIIYQILVDEVGWIEPKSDGVECVYKHNKPFSAIRIALIPKNQKEHIYKMWKEDIGTFNGIY